MCLIFANTIIIIFRIWCRNNINSKESFTFCDSFRNSSISRKQFWKCSPKSERRSRSSPWCWCCKWYSPL